METFESWHKAMHLFCQANAFDPGALRDGLMKYPEQAAGFKARYEWVLQERPCSAEDWADRNDTWFETDDELYEHLQQIYDFLFRDGPHP